MFDNDEKEEYEQAILLKPNHFFLQAQSIIEERFGKHVFSWEEIDSFIKELKIESDIEYNNLLDFMINFMR